MSGGGLTFIYLSFIMILVFCEMLCTWGFLGAGLFFLSGVIDAVILICGVIVISIFTFGAPFVPPPDIVIIYPIGYNVKYYFQNFLNIFKKPRLSIWKVGALVMYWPVRQPRQGLSSYPLG